MNEIIPLCKDWLFGFAENVTAEMMAYGNSIFFNDETRIWQKAGNHGLSKAGNPQTAQWDKVNIPDDFVIRGSFSSDANWKTGSLKGGQAWYLKDFELEDEDFGKSIIIEFDGVYRNSQIFVNGHFIGRRLSGYSSFAYDITDVCQYGKELNRVAVFADATESEQWSYEGGGIYREVRLVKKAPVYITSWGIDIKPDAQTGELHIDVTLCSNLYDETNARVSCRIAGPDGEVVAWAENSQMVEARASAVVGFECKIKNPCLWSVEKPTLYTAEFYINELGAGIENFGFRSIEFDSQTGFYLNGINMKLKGVCCHQDHGGVGIAVPPALQEWRIKRLKELGCNAIRTSHNMPDPALLDACDRLGMLVMDEIRLPGCAEELKRDLCDLVKRDRNHPSVILWSLGNEEPLQNQITGVNLFRSMQQIVKKLDPSRPTTYAQNGLWIDDIDFHEEHNFHFDVFGANYRSGQKSENYDLMHEKYPNWPMLGTETFGGMSTRGLYEMDKSNIPLEYPLSDIFGDECWRDKEHKWYASAYGGTFTPWGYEIEETWSDCVKRPFMAGTFIWTGFDYRGETLPYGWPAVITRFGVLDICGFYKEIAHYLRSWWRPEEPHIFIMPHWNWHERAGEDIRVWCYSNSNQVELFLNGESLGRKDMPKNYRLEWMVPYVAGELKAVGYDPNGSEVVSTARRTASVPVKISLEKNTLKDIIIVNTRVEDSFGELCPRADDQIIFKVTGPAEILGAGNGNPLSHEPERFSNKRHAYHGLCQIILQRTGAGDVTVEASALKLKSSRIEV